ncbi:MAG: type II secretion system F family protein [Candidatus Aenigmarchaeota archaeon]|nr:type II secretion system F family protein [Candidatus Aenigmarchaeota archaeon]
METKRKIIIIPSCVSIALILSGLFLGDVGVLGNLIIISIFITITPYFVYRYSKFLWLKAIENQFPNLVRDLADSARSGMSMPEAIKIATRANYGKLTEEVKKMNNRLSWGTPFLRVLEIFGDKLKDSKLITEELKIIRQSYESGGDIPSTLDSVSKDMLMVKEAEAERSSMVKQHILLMYGIFFMFLGIAVMIVNVMVPMIESQPGAAQGGALGFSFVNPCEGMKMFPCDLFSGIGSMFGVPPTAVASYYIALFFSVIIIQGLCIGLITGQLGEGSIIAGTKHSLIMVFSAFGIFLFLAKVGFLPI